MDSIASEKKKGYSVKMNILHCPTCHTALMAHEPGTCLDRWVYVATGRRLLTQEEMQAEARRLDQFGKRVWSPEHGFLRVARSTWEPYVCEYEQEIPEYSLDVEIAYLLMEWIWEHDPNAEIFKEKILIWINNEHGNEYSAVFVTGPTFPVRVCRAAIWLASQEERT